ncbi:Uncharacterised protein [Veillonella rodentium]|uniref:Uncharacterized protein n=1 Tax=Veillonella rodentium TaxID=248315 RepID=A0A239YC40_9FIRM|nr:Uncharacterised protein [Veillonella rodentium]
MLFAKLTNSGNCFSTKYGLIIISYGVRWLG